MLQCVAVCCSMVQRAAVCCSVLQCVAVFCSVLQCVAVCCNVLQCVAVLQLTCVRACVSCTGIHVLQCVAQCVAVWCSVLQCAAVCCSVLQRAVAFCSVLKCVAVCCSVLQYVVVCCSMLQLSECFALTAPRSLQHAHCNTFTATHSFLPASHHSICRNTVSVLHLFNCNTLQHTATHCNTLTSTSIASLDLLKCRLKGVSECVAVSVLQ